eukprot:7942-Heterococcus_DN1.PRE.5
MLHYRHISCMPVLEAALKTLIIDDEPLVFNPLIGTIHADLMRLVHTLIKMERSKEAVNKKVEGALISKD